MHLIISEFSVLTFSNGKPMFRNSNKIHTIIRVQSYLDTVTVVIRSVENVSAQSSKKIKPVYRNPLFKWIP